MRETYTSCMVCGQGYFISVSPNSILEWRMSGKNVQDFFPDLSDDDRELLLSGICGTCFDIEFPDE